MKYFFVRLLPPRPDFMLTMSPEEQALMQEHGAYWMQLAQKGWAVAYGPVGGEKGGYGAGFWALPDDADITSLTENDPAIKANVGFTYEVNPMPALVKGS